VQSAQLHLAPRAGLFESARALVDQAAADQADGVTRTFVRALPIEELPSFEGVTPGTITRHMALKMSATLLPNNSLRLEQSVRALRPEPYCRRSTTLAIKYVNGS
jgi:hypothetical protein